MISLAASCIVVALLCEVLLGASGWELYPPPYYPGDVEPVRDSTFDSVLGWKLPPDAEIVETTEDYSVTYRSNGLGFRRGPAPAPTSTSRRIAFIGDSYTFGSGVEDDETFAALLEARLAATRSINFGIGAFGVDQMWLTLRHHALPQNPDLVILSFVRSDLDRSLSSYRKDHVWRWKPAFWLRAGSLQPMTPEEKPGPVKRFVHRNSRLYRLWRRLEHSLSRRFPIGYRWQLNRALFEAVRDDCRRAGVPLLVVHIPVNRRRPVPLFGREMARLGIDYLDLGPSLPENADALYYPRDHHLNAAGHDFAAATIQGHLEESGWLLDIAAAPQGRSGSAR